MGGIFSKSNRPTLPGAYVNFQSQTVEAIPPNPGTAVAIPFTHDWGPFETVVRVSSFAEFQNIFGSSDDTDGYRAVRQAFQGEGLEGRGGAGEVVCFRMGAAAAAKAAKTLNNTSSSAAITLTARYEGTRGNDLTVVTQDHAADSTKNELLLFDGTVLVEKYVYTDANITSLAAEINADSDWVTAGSVTTGTALAAISGSTGNLTGGNDGTTILSADWVAALTAFSIHKFAVLCPYGLTDSGIRTTVATWTDDQNDLGNRFFTVFGGAAAESLATASTRSAALANPNIVNVGIGTLTDSTLGSGQTELAISTSEFAARVAGALASRGESQSLTHARFAGVEITVGPTLSELESAFDAGVLALSRDSHATAPVHVKTGLTTWTQTNATADPSKPYLIFRQPKYVRTIHGIETDLTRWAEEGIIGTQIINEQTREAVIGEVKTLLTERQSRGAIQAGWTVGIDQNPPPSDEDEFIALAISLSFARALEQVYFTVSVG
jgi:hypothetical protein